MGSVWRRLIELCSLRSHFAGFHRRTLHAQAGLFAGPKGLLPMTAHTNQGPRSSRAFLAAGLAAMALALMPGAAQAGKLSWLDDVVQEVVLEAKAGGRAAVRGGDGASAHA